MNNDAKILSNNELQSQDPSYLETIFSLANGHFGIRGSNPIQKSSTNGTVINAFYETSPIHYGEAAFGYAQKNQTIVKLPDFYAIDILDAEQNKFSANLIKKTLNMKTGMLISIYTLTNKHNQKIQLTVKSVLSQTNDSFVGLKYEFKSLDYKGQLTIKKYLRPVVYTDNDDDPRKSRTIQTINYQKHTISDSCEVLKVSTKLSHLSVSLGLFSQMQLNQTITLEDEVVLEFIGIVSEINQDLDLEEVPTFQEILSDSNAFWTDFWNNSEITISGNDELNQALHYNIFQLMSSSGRDGKTNIAAKGLSGTGYEGHYFWDTEMYMAPFFDFTNPRIARGLIKYRHSILPAARKRARTLGVSHGVLFAWRTINGQEASAYYPAGTAQYHIDGDVAFGVYRYLLATGDWQFIKDYGFEIVIETARFWREFGSYTEINGRKRFCFYDVTGPDEYTAIVDNNYYTNRMAKFNLSFAVELIQKFPQEAKQLGVTAKEVSDLERIGQEIYLPYSKKFGINQQDDSSFDKPIWPFEKTPKENYPLLLHYHPLTIYRYQVNKQADTLLADFLFDDISESQLKREYNYYEKITTHDSSLSRSIFSALAARIGLKQKAYDYFTDTVRMDLTDLQGNSADGLHLANLGGSWLTVVSGFGGLKVKNGYLYLKNNLPTAWDKMTIRLKLQGRLLSITYLSKKILVKILKGKPLKIFIDGKLTIIK
ncbi:glycoside hydrolase family 65 protein [Companilactobacillus farciminis]|nr:glycoside hydrolase family 65 protein [Companilactobacillus farciminis]